MAARQLAQHWALDESHEPVRWTSQRCSEVTSTRLHVTEPWEVGVQHYVRSASMTTLYLLSIEARERVGTAQTGRRQEGEPAVLLCHERQLLLQAPVLLR